MDLLEKLTSGKNDILILTLQTEGYKDDTIKYRKLTIEEQKHYKRIINKALGKVSTVEKDGFRNNRNREATAEMDIAKSGDAEYEAEVYLIYQSLTIENKPQITKEQIKKMEAPLFEEIAENLKEINRLNDSASDIEKDVKKS